MSDSMLPSGMGQVPEFGAEFRAKLHDLFVWRRDVRRFRAEAIPDGTLERLIQLACLAPSVGLSEPWRFVIVAQPAARCAVRAIFERCNADALKNYAGERARLYAQLKLEGLSTAPGHLAVFADRATLQGHGLGRQTMPETVEYSAVMAIHTMWLAARAEGLGLGWVSILDPVQITAALQAPAAWTLVAYLCIGYPLQEDDAPALQQSGWEQRRPPVVLRR